MRKTDFFSRTRHKINRDLHQSIMVTDLGPVELEQHHELKVEYIDGDGNITDPGKGVKRARNATQTTLDHYRRYITQEQFEAGERLHADCYYAGRIPHATASLIDGTPPAKGGNLAGFAEGHVDCVRRYDYIQRQLRNRYIDRDRGISYWDIVYKVCIEGITIDALEKWSEWPRRSGKKLVGIVLEELCNQYDLFWKKESGIYNK